MTTTQQMHKRDLSGINNLKDLKEEISRIKLIIKMQEKDLEERAKQIPREALIASVNGAVHVVSKRGVPGNIFNLVRNGVGLMMNLKKDKKGMRGVLTQVKELVLFTALSKLVQFYQKKKASEKSPAEHKS